MTRKYVVRPEAAVLTRGFDQDLATAFPKDAPMLREAFNTYLRQIKANGTYDKLVDKYYPGIRRYFPGFFAEKH